MGTCAASGDYAVTQAHNDKLRKFAADCVSAVFSLLMVDTYGGWHKEALAIINRLGTQLAHNVDCKPGEQLRFILQHLAISLVKDCSQKLATWTPAYATIHVDSLLKHIIGFSAVPDLTLCKTLNT